MENVTYNKSNWENSPSTNTPFYADRLNNMDNGVSNCASRANASVPFDNILNSEDADAVTQRDKFLNDAVDMKDVSNRIGTNNVKYGSGDFYYSIKNDSAQKELPLGDFVLTKVKDISPQISGKSIVESSITFDISNLEGHESLLYNKNFVIAMTSSNGYIRAEHGAVLSRVYSAPYVSYNPETGIGKVNGLVTFDSDTNSYFKANISLYILK